MKGGEFLLLGAEGHSIEIFLDVRFYVRYDYLQR
jgi:hypothetical protein